ncbi:MAG: pirin family protein [Candidatus Micrarchaeia archaeon]|jgi:hypothetical protein
MISIVPPQARHCESHGWLQTCFLFSFAGYSDPKNMGWGALRVFNDDRILPGGIFPMHPHAEYEIATLVLEGEITHEDSMGNRRVVGAGGVQAMTAGTGVVHSEANRGSSTLHSFQIWIKPAKKGLAPQYSQKLFGQKDWEGRLCMMASGSGKGGGARISADAAIYRCALVKGEQVSHRALPGRKLLLYVAKGEVGVNGKKAGEACQARIEGEGEISIKAAQDSDFVLIDCPG